MTEILLMEKQNHYPVLKIKVIKNTFKKDSVQMEYDGI